MGVHPRAKELLPPLVQIDLNDLAPAAFAKLYRDNGAILAIVVEGDVNLVMRAVLERVNHRRSVESPPRRHPALAGVSCRMFCCWGERCVGLAVLFR